MVVIGYIKHFSSSQATYGIGLSETHGDPPMAIMDIFTLRWAITYVVSRGFYITSLKAPSHSVLSCFDHIQNYPSLKWRKPENTKEIINHKGTRMAKDGEDGEKPYQTNKAGADPGF